MKQRFSKRTRLVSALLTLAMVFTFLPFSAFAATTETTETTEEIPIDASNFPDEAFREYLLNAKFYESTIKFDKDGNSAFSKEERNAITSINLSKGYNGQKVAKLDGIEHFPNLKTLNCIDNNLTSLDVSKNEKLENLYCDTNPLGSLDVSKNAALKYLSCEQNNLTSLDVSKNTALEILECRQNNLTSLDVSMNTVLKDLDCRQNRLASLDVSKNEKLNNLYCSDNNLTSLDVSNNDKLKNLYCYNNQLTSLNVENTSIDPTGLVLSVLYAQNNVYPIAVETTPRTFNLSILPGFDVSKIINLNGGTVKDNILTVNEGVNQVTYTYDCGKGLSRDFTLNVNVVPDGTVTPPSGGGSTGGTTPGGSTGGSSGGGGGGGGAIIVVAGAAAVGLVGYGIYNYVAERQLQALLPEGAASPENRAQTALLLWNTAGRPEPAAQPAFPDVADPETAKAAQWCVEHGLMNVKLRGRFAPDGSSPAYKTLNAYRQLVG